MQPRGGGHHGGFGYGRDGSGGGRRGHGWGRAGGRQNSWKRKEDAALVNESKGAIDGKSKVIETHEQEQNQSNAKWEGRADQKEGKQPHWGPKGTEPKNPVGGGNNMNRNTTSGPPSGNLNRNTNDAPLPANQNHRIACDNYGLFIHDTSECRR